jgi:hypothetical protein
MKITVNISDADAELIRRFLATTRSVTASSHGPLDMQKLAAMLLEDVALMVRRPGSWEGANMGTVMQSHGYGLGSS